MDEIWDEIDSAEWVANVGIPLAAAMAAIAIAAWLVVRQMRHDRELALAQRRSADARRLAATILNETAVLASPFSDRDQFLSMDRFFTVDAALDEAAVVLNEPEEVGALLGNIRRSNNSISRALLAMREREAEMKAEGWRSDDTHTMWAEQVIRPLVGPIRQAAEELQRWDGHRRTLGRVEWPPLLPEQASASPLGPGDPIPEPDPTLAARVHDFLLAEERWTGYYADQYERLTLWKRPDGESAHNPRGR